MKHSKFYFCTFRYWLFKESSKPIFYYNFEVQSLGLKQNTKDSFGHVAIIGVYEYITFQSHYVIQSCQSILKLFDTLEKGLFHEESVDNLPTYVFVPCLYIFPSNGNTYATSKGNLFYCSSIPLHIYSTRSDYRTWEIKSAIIISITTVQNQIYVITFTYWKVARGRDN